MKMKPKKDNQNEKLDFENIIINMKNLDHPYILKLFESYEDRIDLKDINVERKLLISSNRKMIEK